MGFSISTSLLRGRLQDKFQQAADAGFTAIDINYQDIITSESSPKQIAQIAKSYHLSVHKHLPFYNLEGFVGVKRVQSIKRFAARLRMTQELGACMMLICSSTASDSESDRDQIVVDLRQAAEMAAAKDVKLAYLALPWGTLINESLDAYDLVKTVDHAAFGLALNSYFALSDGAKPASFRDVAGEKIFSIQLADAPDTDFAISHFKHEFANLPGLGALSLTNFVSIMSNNGYCGKWSLGRIRHNDYEQPNLAGDGYRALVNVIDQSVGSSVNLLKSMPALPGRALARGVEFLEFAVDKNSGAELRLLLTSLCFRLEKTHKTKSVELWRQGAINIVLNDAHDGVAYEVLKLNGPGVCDIGLRVGDAQITADRAQALGIKTISQAVGDQELKIPAIQGIGHSIMHFIDEKSDLHRVWDIEFDTVDATNVVAPSGLRRIDHIAQSMNNRELDSWLLFYLSVFEMKKSSLVDVADLAGIVYSRAVESPEGEIRLNLNGASSHHTYSGAFLAKRVEAGVQHIALATDDIFETSTRLAEAGFIRLKIPNNYYDDLAINYDLDKSLEQKLRSENILYSKNASGEYFQIYSKSIWGGFFIEIVERRGGYDGYGARNAPIRLAAQQIVSST